ncbi:hypothetical protein CC80DRAFT_576171 [Byssothecium circinans]|uniref:Extracellular membrane protein CFEM domain-containing protein n=1 Tax=Byssothecium circinans TaxID=147558 RepID=A0A6A5THH1_9PLEO|nr:hypothetical protein CC80DRAFT_576171 [Byssothecium circinans]
MSSIDGTYSPFVKYPGYATMAPCMRSCNGDYGYNGCDNSGCWCNKGNLDLRIASMQRCASTSCTFSNMNTASDLSIMSGIQVLYCVDRGHSPEGMTVPSMTEARTTSRSGGNSSPTATGGSETTGTGTGGTVSRTNQSENPCCLPPNQVTSLLTVPGSSNSNTSQSSSPTTNSSSSGLNTAAKAGIAIGAVFCVLLAVAIILLLLRRKKQHQQSPPEYYPPQISSQNPFPPPGMAPTPYSGNTPFNPPLQQPVPLHAPQANNAAFATEKGGTGTGVSPMDEKNGGAGVPSPFTRKEVGSPLSNSNTSPQTSPTLKGTTIHHSTSPPVPTPSEVHGSLPSPRHEVHNDGEISNTVSTRGMELDGQPVQQYPSAGYQESRQGQWAYNTPGQVYEVDGGQQSRSAHTTPPSALEAVDNQTPTRANYPAHHPSPNQRYSTHESSSSHPRQPAAEGYNPQYDTSSQFHAPHSNPSISPELSVTSLIFSSMRSYLPLFRIIETPRRTAQENDTTSAEHPRAFAISVQIPFVGISSSPPNSQPHSPAQNINININIQSPPRHKVRMQYQRHLPSNSYHESPLSLHHGTSLKFIFKNIHEIPPD